MVLIFQRFYKNLFGDEGYLMHTLPVKSSENLSSKLLIALLSIVVSSLVGVFSLLVMGYTFKGFKTMLFNTELSSFVVLLGLFIVFLLTVCKILLIAYTSIVIGSLSENRKILISCFTFIAFNLLINIVWKKQQNINVHNVRWKKIFRRRL